MFLSGILIFLENVHIHNPKLKRTAGGFIQALYRNSGLPFGVKSASGNFQQHEYFTFLVGHKLILTFFGAEKSIPKKVSIFMVCSLYTADGYKDRSL